MLHKDKDTEWLFETGTLDIVQEIKRHLEFNLKDCEECRPKMSILFKSILHEIHKEFADKIKNTELLFQQSSTDYLTQLLNRNGIMNVLEERCRNNSSIFALFFLDLDNFKEVNDTLTHEAGDQLLVELSKRLKSHSRQEDIVGRWGGDEFIIITHALTKRSDVDHLADKLLKSIVEPFPQFERFNISGSMGVALYPYHGMMPDVLLKHADIAMYESKNKGKNQYTIFKGE